ncbi:BglG family transcription antiterminator [Enterococcus sp. LJL51]|uniref:BglG family transcription antiterminator n=1 Tax=Enterococcus sp. LJL51 TaxID=3416656 RepID=UPI003CE7098A
MKKKQEQLLTFLLQQKQPTSSRVLANVLDVSIRTVKNYVSELNHTGSQPLIFSSNLGYTVNRDYARQLLNKKKDTGNLPQTYKERAFYIIKKILIDHQQLDTFDLTEELYVSYSTLKGDISRMNKSFEKYNVRFAIKNDLIQISGEEKEKRRLISYIIFEEMPYHFMNQEILKQNFAPEDVVKLSIIIQATMKESNYHLNDFSFMNLMLHLLILIESVRNGKSLVSRDWFSSWLRQDKAQLVTCLIEELENSFDLQLNELEKEEIHMLFQANANYIPSNNIKELEQIAGADILTAMNTILHNVHQTFGINLSSESFIVPFALHLSGLFSRAKQDSFLKNPMLESLKKDYPIVYDIAIFISLQLSEHFDIKITEDESAYIALHIGAELEGQKRNFSKIRTVVLCPKYMKLDEKLYSRLSQHFGNDLNILAVVSQLSESETLTFDLLITTVPVPKTGNYKILNISPFYTEEQRLMLISEIATIRLNQKKQILSKNFDAYFSKKFFFTDSNAEQPAALIKQMCLSLETEGIVTEEFYPHVLERENASSTAFDSIAIPHSVYMDAAKTTIAVLINPNGINWNGHKVFVILLAAINDLDRQCFTDIYEALVSLFDYPEVYSELRSVKSFEEFRLFIQSKAKKGG